MSNNSVIEHRANYYYIMMQEDYLAICSSGKGSPHCKAMILSVLEHWTNTKRDKCEGEYVYLTMPQWIKYTYMLYERNIITDCIKELLEEGKIERRPIIMFSQKTFDYKLCTEKIQECIRALPTKSKDEVTPNLQAYLAFKERGKAERAEKKEKDGVGEKSRTTKKGKMESEEVREKSPTVREKSPKVGDNSHRVREKSPQLILSNTPLPSTNIQSDAVAFAPHHDTPASFSQGSSPDFSTQANAAENHGQLADSSTVSLARDNGVRETPQPLSTPERVNTPQGVESSLNASTDTPLKASDHIAAVATRNPDEDHAPLSRSGESATTGDRETPTESSAPEEAPTRRTRKPTEKKEGPTKAQIDAVYVVFDELFRETMETPDPDFSCTHTKTSTEAIKELITRKATPARLRAVFKDMWDEDRDGVYWWRSHGHMTIKAVCNNYGARVLSLESARGKVSAKDKPVNAKTVLEALTATSSYQPLQFAQPRPLRKAE